MKTKVLLLILVLYGCASSEAYENYLNSLDGISEEELISKEGIPTNVYELKNKKYYTYLVSSSYTSPQQGFTNGNFNNYGNFSGHTMTTGGYNYTMYCKTTFTIENDKVVNWRFEGTMCRM